MEALKENPIISNDVGAEEESNKRQLKKRSSIFEREGPEPHVELQERDFLILMALSEQRVLTSQFIGWAYFYGQSAHTSINGIVQAPRVALNRLKKLWQAGYVDRVFMGKEKYEDQNRIVYILTEVGLLVLRKYVNRKNIDVTKLSLKTGKPHRLFIDHTLNVARFWSALTAACTNHTRNISIEHWRGERRLKSDGLIGRIMIRAGAREQEYIVMPDGTFGLCIGGKEKIRCFLEVDRGTEDLGEIRRKMNGYEEYLRSVHYRENYGEAKCYIIWMVDGQRRLENILEISREVGQKRAQSILPGRVFGTLTEAITPLTILGSIWQTPESEERRALVDAKHVDYVWPMKI